MTRIRNKHKEGSMKTQTAWTVTRYSADGYSYIDILSIASLPDMALEEAQEVDRQCGPQWAANNVIGQAIEVTISKKEA